MGGVSNMEIRTPYLLDEVEKVFQKGDVFVFVHRPTISVRIIDIVVDDKFTTTSDEAAKEVKHVVYSFSLDEKNAKIMPIEQFAEFLNSGMLQKTTEHKYSPGDAFYGINGLLYVIQCRSNIYHPDIGLRYFVTVIKVLDQEDCDEDIWGNYLAKRYIIEEAILDERTLDKLEPYDKGFIVDDLDFDTLFKEYEKLEVGQNSTKRVGVTREKGYER